MRAAGTGGAPATAEPAGQLGLAGGGERRAFLVADTDPFDVAAPYRVGKRIERVADQAENVFDPDLFEHADQYVRYGLSHRDLLLRRRTYRCTGTQRAASAERHALCFRPQRGEDRDHDRDGA